MSPALPLRPGYDPSDAGSILRFGLKIKGKTAREICALSGVSDPSALPGWKGSKSVLGDVMEAYYGIAKNNSPMADFPEAGVELKVLPIKRGTRKGGFLVKEPTSISMIDYVSLPSETWEGPAAVRKKLERILFAFFVIEAPDVMASALRAVELWAAGDLDRALFREDWEDTRAKVASGRAHLLSESDAKVLGARRKGAGGEGSDLRYYRADAPPAKSRAWALKSAFTRQIFEERVLGVKFERAVSQAIVETARDPIALAVDRIQTVLKPFEGRTLLDIAKAKGLSVGQGKNLAATIIKKALGFTNVNAKILELEQLGIDVKTLNLRGSDGWPFEAVSFPSVHLRELVKQEWEGLEADDGTTVKEGSELHDQLRSILFVPTYSARDGLPQRERILGSPFLWAPSDEEWTTIRREWEMYREEVAEGKARYHFIEGGTRRRNDLTKASQTKIIHMRPHGRRAADEDIDPRGNRVTKQCFWLNQRFVQELVRTRTWPPPTRSEEG